MKTIERPSIVPVWLRAAAMILAVVTLSCNALSGIGGSKVEWLTFSQAEVKDIFRESAAAFDPGDSLLEDISAVSFNDRGSGIMVFGPYTRSDGSTAEGSYHLSLQIQDGMLQLTVDSVQIEEIQSDDPRLERLGGALADGVIAACRGEAKRVTFDYIELGSDTLRLKVRR